jgi:hypothetical protein
MTTEPWPLMVGGGGGRTETADRWLAHQEEPMADSDLCCNVSESARNPGPNAPSGHHVD